MSGPWEAYQQPAAGPWEEFQTTNEPTEDSMWQERQRQILPDLAKNLGGVVETGMGMVAGLPAQIAGGLAGAGDIMMGRGVDKAVKTLEDVQRENFGFGEYKPSSARGQEYLEGTTQALQKPIEWAGAAGEYLGGNEGRYIGELLSGTAMEMLDPAAIGVGIRGVRGKAAKRDVTGPSKSTDTLIDRLEKLEQEAAGPNPAELFDKGVGEQGNLFADDGTGYATPYDAGQMGTFEPVTPKRAARQMDLPFGEDLPGTINIDEAGVSLRPEDMPGADAAKNAELARMDEEARLTGNKEFLGAKQDEMWATDTTGDLMPSGEMAKLTPEAPRIPKTQEELFAPHTNMHRDYTDLRVDDGKGGERPLTKQEFGQTLQNLYKTDGTRFELPENMDAAYQDYQRNLKQPGLFDIPSRAATPTKVDPKLSLENIAKGKISSKGSVGRQRGAMDLRELNLGFGALQRRLSKLTDVLGNDTKWQDAMRRSFGGQEFLRNADGTPKVLLHGTTADIAGDLRSSEQGFHAGTTAESHFFVTDNVWTGNGKAYANARRTRENGQIHPLAIKEGNYPEIELDAGDWTPTRIVNPPASATESFKLREIISNALREKGYSDTQIQGLYNYVSAKRTVKEVNEAFSDVLKRAGIDGFFYKNRAESPKGQKLASMNKRGQVGDLNYRRRAEAVVGSDHPYSFVTWNDRNYKSIFDTPQAPTPRTEKPIGKRGFANKQTGAIDLFSRKGGLDTRIEAVQKQIDDLGRRYVNGSIDFDAFSENNKELIYKKLELERELRTNKQGIPATSVEEVFPGYNTIPVGSTILATSGLTYAEPTRGKVVGTHGFRYGEKAYNLPLVDFGDGNPRKILPADIKEVFTGPRDPFKGPGKNQAGAINLFGPAKEGSIVDKIKKNFKIVDNSMVRDVDDTMIPKNPETQDVIDRALAEGKDGNLWAYTQSGSTSAAMKSGSAVIKAVGEIVQNAVKRADYATRHFIYPAEQSLKKLSRQEIKDLGDVFKAEMTRGERFSGDTLIQTLSTKQLEAYTNARDMFDRALDAQNAERVAKGQKPVTANEAYMSSRWNGDFRRPVYDADGKLVWYLAANTRRGLENQFKALQKEVPGVVAGKDHTVRSQMGQTDLQSMYTKMLDILGRDDPAIEKIRLAIEDQMVTEGAGTLNQEKHFEKKAGIRGFVGDRPGKGGVSETLAMFQQQIQYAKNAHTWSAMQKAADDAKGILSNEELQTQQPNNIKYAREYFKNAIGMGESKVTRALSDTIRDGLGVSPKLIDNAVGDLKSFFILQKLAASTGYTVANLVQTSNVLPYLVDLRTKGYKGNIVTSLGAGIPFGILMAATHYAQSPTMNITSQLPTQFLRDAFQYVEDNSVTARSIYDESPIETSFNKLGAVANVAAKTMTVPETGIRSVAFMTYAQFLKESGKFSDNNKLFQKAEELVNASMVDYRSTERPMMYSKLGTIGNFLNTLQTFPVSFYNQYLYMGTQALKGNPTGLITMMALQYAMAGAMGLPGFDDMDKIYKAIRDNWVPTSAYNHMMKSPFLSDPKLWLMENAGKSSVYGALSENTGLGLTSRIAAPGAGAMFASPVGPITDIGKQVGNWASAITSVDDKAKWATAAMSSAPVGLQGLLETSGIMKDLTYVERPDGTKLYMKTSDLTDMKGNYARTPEEEAVRRFGLRSQKEVAARDIAYATDSANKTLAKKSGELIDSYYSAIVQGNTKRAAELDRLYMDLTGRDEGISDAMLEKQIMDRHLSSIERTGLNATTGRQLQNVGRMHKLLKEKENAPE